MQNTMKKTGSLKKITVRVAGPVRLTAAASAIYGNTCDPGTPSFPPLFPH
ncbi:hypothetical protein [Streptomyces sp. NPDC059479]